MTEPYIDECGDVSRMEEELRSLKTVKAEHVLIKQELDDLLMERARLYARIGELESQLTAATRMSIRTPEGTEYIVQAFADGLNRRTQKHGEKPHASTMETLGIVTEEYHEFVEACRNGTDHEVFGEAVDIAVAAMWTFK